MKLLDSKLDIDFSKIKQTSIACFLQKTVTWFVQMEERIVRGKTFLANRVYVAYTECKKLLCRTMFSAFPECVGFYFRCVNRSVEWYNSRDQLLHCRREGEFVCPWKQSRRSQQLNNP